MSGNLQVASGEENSEDVTSKRAYLRVFLVLLVAGFLTFFVGMILLAVAASLLRQGNSASFGVIIFLGPFPIVVGAGPQRVLVLLIAVLIAVLTVTALLLVRKRTRRQDDWGFSQSFFSSSP